MRGAVMFLLLTAMPAAAQSPAPAVSPASPAPPQVDIGRVLLDQELSGTAGGYAYTSQGRRDPFVSLLKPVDATSAKTRPPGIAGFLIQEVALKGIVKGPKGYTAMLLGTNNSSYFVTVGQRLYDGVVSAIDASSITFRQEVSDPLSTVKSRDVKKSLYPSEEGR